MARQLSVQEVNSWMNDAVGYGGFPGMPGMGDIGGFRGLDDENAEDH